MPGAFAPILLDRLWALQSSDLLVEFGAGLLAFGDLAGQPGDLPHPVAPGELLGGFDVAAGLASPIGKSFAATAACSNAPLGASVIQLMLHLRCAMTRLSSLLVPPIDTGIRCSTPAVWPLRTRNASTAGATCLS